MVYNNNSFPEVLHHGLYGNAYAQQFPSLFQGRFTFIPEENTTWLYDSYKREQNSIYGAIPIGTIYWIPQERQYILTVPEVQQLKGKKIRTTVPNIAGTITATVGEYNATTNRVTLIGIRSDRTGIDYGTLSYLPEELAGLQEITGQGPTQPQPQGCTGGTGKLIDQGSQTVFGINVNYVIYECEIHITGGGQRYVLSRTQNSVGITFPLNPLQRIKGSIYVQNKTLWIEAEQQHKNPLTGKWLKTFGGKTKLGSWASLKF